MIKPIQHFSFGSGTILACRVSVVHVTYGPRCESFVQHYQCIFKEVNMTMTNNVIDFKNIESHWMNGVLRSIGLSFHIFVVNVIVCY